MSSKSGMESGSGSIPEMDSETDEPVGKPDPADALAQLKNSMLSVQLSTVGEHGDPHCGYTPFIFDDGGIIIFVSQLARHTRDLLHNGRVSAMLIADEADASQIFARTRVTYQCKAITIERKAVEYLHLLDLLQARHGKMIGLLRELPDFVLFRLQPSHGQFVMGFGQAYTLSGKNLDQFEHARRA